MVDLTQFLTIAGLAVLVGLIVQLIKARIEVSYVPWVAIATGIVLANAIAYVLGKISTPADLLSFVIGGFLAGLASVGAYEASVDKIKPRG